MWRFGIESTVSQRGEFADVQMEDLHMEHFRRIDGRWVNQKDGSEKFHLVDTMDGYRLTDYGGRFWIKSYFNRN